MAKEIQVAGITPSITTFYARITNPTTGQIWNTTVGVFQNYATATIAQYRTDLTEEGTASGYYTGTFPPTIPAGTYDVLVYQRLGGAAAQTDPPIAQGKITWNGSSAFGGVSVDLWAGYQAQIDSNNNPLVVVRGWYDVDLDSTAQVTLNPAHDRPLVAADVLTVLNDPVPATYLTALANASLATVSGTSTTTSVVFTPGGLSASIVGFGIMRADSADLSVSMITAFNPGTDTATLYPPLAFAPAVDDLLILLPPVSLVDRAITDNKIVMPAEAAGIPSTPLGILRRGWEWATRKITRNRTTGVVSLFGADDTTVLETKTQSTAGVTDTQSKGV
jgi:hypothetical protein